MPSISKSHLGRKPWLVGPGCLSSSLRPSFLGGNVPAFFYHFFSFCFPLPLLIYSLLLGVEGSRKRRELSLAGSLGSLVPDLRFHHFQQATPDSALDTHLVWQRCSFWRKMAEVTNCSLRRPGMIKNLVQVL